MYADGEGSALFSLSLARAYRQNGLVDFERVEGMPGIFLANQISISALEDYDFDYEKYISTKVMLDPATALDHSTAVTSVPCSKLGWEICAVLERLRTELVWICCPAHHWKCCSM